jgi:hypothetical protein
MIVYLQIFGYMATGLMVLQKVQEECVLIPHPRCKKAGVCDIPIREKVRSVTGVVVFGVGWMSFQLSSPASSPPRPTHENNMFCNDLATLPHSNPQIE